MQNEENYIQSIAPVRIKILGLGDAGSRTLESLSLSNLPLVAINTDVQALRASSVSEKYMIGKSVTRGLSCGGDIELGCRAAREEKDQIAQWVKKVDLVFLLAGLGGGMGSGATPVVAEVASECGALVIAFVTLPFAMEGTVRRRKAEESLIALRRVCDAVIVLPNDILLQQLEKNATVLDAFSEAGNWIRRGVGSICSILQKTGLINLDFATLQKMFASRGGKTLFGLGSGRGETAVTEALNDLQLCPLLYTPDVARRADHLLINIIGGGRLHMDEVQGILSVLTERFGNKENTLVGAIIDEDMEDRLEICVLGVADFGKHSTVLPGAKRPKQMEFDFVEKEVIRGYFEKTESNYVEGEDLDVPTYLRRGIKIVL